MGYSTLFYAVDLVGLSHAVGSGDVRFSRQFEDEFPDQLEGRLDDDDLPLREAFAELIANSFTSPDSGHQYGYALEILCRLIGSHLPDEDAIGDLEPLQLESPLENSRHPLEIPKELGQFPRISYLDPSEVDMERARLSSIDLAFPNDEDIEEARMAYGECINQAAKQNLAVVTFYY